MGSNPLIRLLQFVILVDPDCVLFQIFEKLSIRYKSFDFFQDLSYKLNVALVVSLKVDAE